MISIEQLNGEIAALEDEYPTHVVMQKLANLYTVRDHIAIGTAKVGYRGETDFAKAVDGKDTTAILGIMDELMEAVRVFNPKLYDHTMELLQE